MTPEYITVHCAATQNKASIDADTIRSWHKNKGWRDIGYHFVITTDGTVQPGRPLNQQGAHVYGKNRDNIGICLVGGVNEHSHSVDNFTNAQFAALAATINTLKHVYNIKEVLGHRDWPDVAKDCPCFDVKTWMESL